MLDETENLCTEEIADLWEQSGEDIKVGDHGVAYYCGRKIADPDENGNADFQAIAQWCEDHQYWPNVWLVNDHGNVELCDVHGNCYGGLV